MMAGEQIIAWVEKGADCCRAQECEQAIGLLEGMAQVAPEIAAVHYYLGICYTGRCRQHLLVDLGAAHFHLQRALFLLGTAAEPGERAVILSALGNTYAASRHLPAKARLHAAMQCHEQAGAIYRSEGRLEEWAREEFNLGNAFSELPEDAADKWTAAIHHYENALQVRTRERDPSAYAGTLQNLGIALRELPSGDRAAQIKQSIVCYRHALQVYRGMLQRRGSAVAHNNLGNSFLSLAEVEKSRALRHIQRSLRHYDRALALYCGEEMHSECAMALFNRGQALVQLARLSRMQPAFELRQACACFAEAAQHWQRANNLDLVQKSREQLEQIAHVGSNMPVL